MNRSLKKAAGLLRGYRGSSRTLKLYGAGCFRGASTAELHCCSSFLELLSHSRSPKLHPKADYDTSHCCRGVSFLFFCP